MPLDIFHNYCNPADDTPIYKEYHTMSLTIPQPTGYSAFWQQVGDKSPYSMQISAGQHRAKGAWHVSKLFSKYGTRDARAALAVLIGAAAGTVATNGYTSVPLPAGPSAAVPQVTGITDLGGLRNAVTIASYNRTTSTPDVNELKRWFSTALMEQGITQPTALGWTGNAAKLKGGMSSFV